MPTHMTLHMHLQAFASQIEGLFSVLLAVQYEAFHS